MVDHRPLVVVTGATGFLASWIMKYLLEEGTMRIRGTVRDKTNTKKLEPLRQLINNDKLLAQIEFVNADLLDTQSIINACEGATYLIHTASPVVFNQPKDASVLVKPAVEGTLAAMRGAHLHKLKRVVLTSSVAAVQCSKVPKEEYNEEDWSDPQSPAMMPYYLSKYKAEKAAWDYIDNLPEDQKFELVTICPSQIMGPTTINGQFFSATMILLTMANILKKRIPVIVNVVDVREVAQAHIRSVTLERAKNQRFILAAEPIVYSDVMDMLDEEFKADYDLPSKEFYTLEEVQAQAKAGNSIMKEIAHHWNSKRRFDNSKSKNLLGIEYRPLKQSYVEMTHSLIDAGQIPDKRRGNKKQHAKL